MRHGSGAFTFCLPGSPKVNAGGASALGCRGDVWEREFRLHSSHQDVENLSIIRAEILIPVGSERSGPVSQFAGTMVRARVMDGGGRLARSMRSPRLRTELAAAAGVAVDFARAL